MAQVSIVTKRLRWKYNSPCVGIACLSSPIFAHFFLIFRIERLWVSNRFYFLFLAAVRRHQNGPHTLRMRKLFIELCCTIPVRLYCILPYLNMFMDPVISALNSTPSMIKQVNEIDLILIYFFHFGLLKFFLSFFKVKNINVLNTSILIHYFNYCFTL